MIHREIEARMTVQTGPAPDWDQAAWLASEYAKASAANLAANRAADCECCAAVPAAHNPSAPCARCGHYAAFSTVRFAR
jgi:hypothetical protein